MEKPDNLPASPPPIRSIDKFRAEAFGRDFAHGRRLSVNDPIVRTLIAGIKRSLGKIRRRNRLAADRAERQPALFPANKTVTEFSQGERRETPQAKTEERK